MCLGDSYEAPNGTMFRVIGTTPDLFDKIEYGRESDGTPMRYEFQAGGRNLRGCQPTARRSVSRSGVRGGRRLGRGGASRG